LAADKTRAGVLGRGSAHVFGARSFGSVPDLELDGVALAEVVETLALDGTLMEKVVFPASVLDEPEALVHS
jgi:hypothetical protein